MVSDSYRFGPYRLYPADHLLLRDDQAVLLAPKAFELLVVMAQSEGRLMRRTALMEAVWPDSFVEEINLTVNISLLRKALGVLPDGRLYIETVPKLGYRFTAPVEVVPAEVNGHAGRSEAPVEDLKPPSASVAADLPVVHPSAPGVVFGRAWQLAVAALLGIAIVGWYLWRNEHPMAGSATVAAPVHSLAVLPFTFIGEDASLAYLGLGMTDALVTRLGGQNRVIVRPIGSVRQYSGTTDPLKAGRNLRVDAVLDGTIQRAAGDTRVTVRLLQVTTGATLWSESFDEAMGTAFALEDTISERLAQALTLQLTEGEQRRLAAPRTQNVAAYDLYTRGRYEWNQRTIESVRKSIDLFGQAIQMDPNYAAAYAGLADAYILAGSYGNSFIAPTISAPKAEEAVTRALALDANSPEAHTSLAYLRLTYDWDWPGAEREFERAISIDPSYVNAHHWYSHELLALGRVAESHEQSEIAMSLDPTDIVVNEHMAWHHLFARQYDEAIAQGLKAVEIDPQFVQAHRVLGLAYLYRGEAKKATEEFATGVRLSREDPVALAYQARCYALTHQEAEARRILTDLEKASHERYISSAEIGAVYASLGDRASAIRWLNKAADERASALIYLNIDPVFDGMRTDDAFEAVVARVHLQAHAGAS